MALRALPQAAGAYRMKDLCELTGLPRQVIHFYIQQGLVPEGHKTGPNMAYYGEEHLECGRPILYTSADSVLQLAAHTSLCSNHIFIAGNEEQRRKYIPKLATGEFLGAKETVFQNVFDRIDPQTGALTATGKEIPVPAPVCLKMELIP